MCQTPVTQQTSVSKRTHLSHTHSPHQHRASFCQWVRVIPTFTFHLDCPSTAGCSPPSMSSIVLSLLPSCFTFYQDFVHLLQDVALHQCLPLSSVAFLFHFSPRLCPSTAGCSPPSMPSIVLCLFLTFPPFTLHLSPRLCPSTAGCSPPSMPSIVFCLLLSCFTFHLGFVHPLQDVALHQCLPLSSVCCFPVSPFT